jgi:hypothetical protein
MKRNSNDRVNRLGKVSHTHRAPSSVEPIVIAPISFKEYFKRINRLFAKQLQVESDIKLLMRLYYTGKVIS